MNKIIYLGAVLPVLALMVPEAFAESDSQHFAAGWQDGENTAASDISTGQYNSYSGANSQCPSGHTHHYCQGYNAGYSDEFSRSLAQNGNTVQTQGASQSTNIKGDNNKVTNIINQGQAVQGSSGGGTFKGDNPRCVLICASIK